MGSKNLMEEEIADLFEVKQRYINFIKKNSVDKNNFLKEKNYINR